MFKPRLIGSRHGCSVRLPAFAEAKQSSPTTGVFFMGVDVNADQIERAVNEAFKTVFRKMAAEDKPATPPPATGNRYVRGFMKD